jgi:hypothetical protein
VSTSTGAPLNLTKPDAGDQISLSVLNDNFTSINTTAGDHETRLDTIEANNWVTNVRIASGVNGDKVTSGTVYNSARWNGAKVYIQTDAPTSGMVTGDIWFKRQA